MANPKILYTDLSEYSFSSSHGTNASYPLTNLNNYRLNSYWSGSSTAQGQRLIIDLGADTSVTTVIIDGHNFTGCGADQSIKIQYATDQAFTSGVTNWSSDIAQSDDTTVIATAASVSKRYWAIVYNSGGALTAAPRIGNIYIGTPLTFTTPYNYGYKTENAEYQTSEKQTLSGIKRSSQIFKGRIVYELDFTYQDSTFVTDFQTFVKTVRGKLYPFYFIDTDGSTVRYMNLESDYVPVSVPSYGFGNVDTIVMKTNQSVF